MKIEILSRIKRLIIPKRIKVATMHFMLTAGVIFIIGFDPFKNYDLIIQDPKGRSWLLVGSVFLYWLIYFIFYKVLKLVLRYFFHSRLREKVRNERNQLLNDYSFTNKKYTYLFTTEMSTFYYKYFMKMGLITTNDLSVPLTVTLSKKEDMFNEVLEDQYSWILLIFHSLITTIVVFNFYAWWFIAIMILAIVVMLFFVIIMVYLLMHFESLELIRRQLLKQSNNLM